jgi:hypothetical protein
METAGTRLLAFVTTATSLTEAGTNAAANTASFALAALCRLNSI